MIPKIFRYAQLWILWQASFVRKVKNDYYVDSNDITEVSTVRIIYLHIRKVGSMENNSEKKPCKRKWSKLKNDTFHSKMIAADLVIYLHGVSNQKNGMLSWMCAYRDANGSNDTFFFSSLDTC